MKRFLPIFLIVGFMLSLLFQQCAVIVPPSGGPMDTIPPVMVKSVPLPNSTNYKKEKLIFTFDEYIKLDKLHEKLVLSPPQGRLPQTKIKGKSLEVRFSEPLADSTTYVLYFSDAIQDNNEGNPISSFEFAFSTGSYIDSLWYTGRLINAYTLEPELGVLVMLYEGFSDSIPILQRPRYVTKTDKEGLFQLKNLKLKDYKIFALMDGNSNYLFDQITESIAFSPDPIDSQSLLSPTDTVRLDNGLQILRLFKEKSRQLSLTDYTRTQRRKIRLGFSQKQNNAVSITPINFEVDNNQSWYIQGSNTEGDSIDFWILPPKMSLQDSLRMRISYMRTDSLMNLKEQVDTLMFIYKEPKRPTKGRRSFPSEDTPQEEKKGYQRIKTSASGNLSILPHQPFELIFNMPQLVVDTSLMVLTNLTDSINIPLPVPERDSINPSVYSLKRNWEHETSYMLTILPEAFVNLDSIANDTLMVKFKGVNPESFGVINLTLTGVTHNVVAELVTSDGKTFHQEIIEADGLVTFRYIKPGQYFIRLIEDINGNGEWDTGSYLDNRQPEPVHIYKDPNGERSIQVRANWDYDLSFSIK